MHNIMLCMQAIHSAPRLFVIALKFPFNASQDLADIAFHSTADMTDPSLMECVPIQCKQGLQLGRAACTQCGASWVIG